MIAGCQMVSMNFQTHGAPMQFYDSFFFDQLNQTSGYVAKPLLLCKQPPTAGPYKAFRLEISLFSAQFLHLLTPKCRKGVGRVIVRLDLYDLPHNFAVNKWEVVATKTDDTFNTLFEANSLIFDKIVAPELAMLHIRVLDENGSKLGQRFLRVNQIQSGKICYKILHNT
jgi:phosphatidylinositol phospholipase C beta